MLKWRSFTDVIVQVAGDKSQIPKNVLGRGVET